MTTVIVGGGAAGLSLAVLLPHAEVLEAEPVAGGLCRSTRIGGFTWDQGPHVLGGIPWAVEWIVQTTGIEYVTGHTGNRGWWRGEYVEHPFTDPLVGELYRAKMWKASPAQLSQPALGAQPGRRPGGVSEFRYPALGGYQAITDAWAAQLGDRLHLGRAEHDRHDRVVWTAPRADLPYNDLLTVTCGFEGPAPEGTAVYIPGPETPFHRVSFPSNFSPHNAPKGCYTVQGEITLSAGAQQPRDAPGEFLGLLGELGIAREPLFLQVRHSPNAYPVPTLAAERMLNEPSAVTHHGRSGAHAYVNLDGVVAAGMALAERLAA